MRVLREIARDAAAIARAFKTENPNLSHYIATMSHNGSLVLVLTRLAEAAHRQRIPVLGGLLRRAQTVVFGIEIARDARLGEGVVFAHPVGVVIGGDAQIGARVMFLGSNTLGSVGNGGYPRIGDDVIIGAGARILGSVTIGNGASIGANAVVLCDVPAGAVALGVPAVVRSRRDGHARPPSPAHEP